MLSCVAVTPVAAMTTAEVHAECNVPVGSSCLGVCVVDYCTMLVDSMSCNVDHNITLMF